MPDLYTCDLETLTEADVRAFVQTAIDTRLNAESRYLEFKSQRDRNGNVAIAVAGMANADGGVVLVGVSERESDPVTGVPGREFEAIVQSLQKHGLHTATEVVPISVSARDDRAVIILRVDPERFVRPVVLADGRVVIRVPGQTVGATSDQIRALFNSTTVFGGPAQATPVSDLANIRVLGGNPKPVEARVLASALLPARALHQQRLGTAALNASVDQLRRSSIPSMLLSSPPGHFEERRTWWNPVDSSATRFELAADRREGDSGWPNVDMSALVILAGRHLQAVIATGLSPADTSNPALAPGHSDLLELLFGTAVVASTLCQTVAAAIGFESPLNRCSLTAALTGTQGVNALSAGHQWRRVGTATQATNWPLPSTNVPNFKDVALIEAAVKDWVTHLLLDLGYTGFEDDVDGWTAPNWLATTESA